MHGSTLPGFLTVARSGSELPSEINTALLLFITLAALLVMFIIVVALMSVHRRRQAAKGRASRSAAPSADIWRESGQRLKVGDIDEGR